VFAELGDVICTSSNFSFFRYIHIFACLTLNGLAIPRAFDKNGGIQDCECSPISKVHSVVASKIVAATQPQPPGFDVHKRGGCLSRGLVVLQP